MAHVFYTLSHVADPLTGVAAPHRTAVDLLSHRALFMPARITDIGTAIKVVSVPSVLGDTRGPEVPPSSTWLFSYLRRFLIQHVRPVTQTSQPPGFKFLLSAMLKVHGLRRQLAPPAVCVVHGACHRILI